MGDVVTLGTVAELRRRRAEWLTMDAALAADPDNVELRHKTHRANLYLSHLVTFRHLPALLALAEQALTAPRLPYAIEKDGRRYEAATAGQLHELMAGTVDRGSGNVFADLGLDDAGGLLARAKAGERVDGSAAPSMDGGTVPPYAGILAAEQTRCINYDITFGPSVTFDPPIAATVIPPSMDADTPHVVGGGT